MAVGLTGVAIGVGVTVAGVLILRNEKNRKKMERVFTDLKNKVTGFGKDVTDKIENDKEIVGKKTVKIIKKTSKKVTN